MSALRLLADPALLVLSLVVSAAAGTSSLDAAAAGLRDAGLHWPLLFAAAALAVTLLSNIEPELEWTGRDLAMLQFASQLRALTILSLLATLLLPFGLAPAGSTIEIWVPGAALWAVKVTVLGVLAAGLQRWRRRLRAEQAPELAALGLLLALLAAALLFAGQIAA